MTAGPDQAQPAPSSASGEERTQLEQSTGELFGDLWPAYDQQLFDESVELFYRRLDLVGFDREWFRGKACLDAGCGGGRNSIAMARLGAERVVGIDLGAQGLEDARRRAEGLGNVSFEHGSILDLPFDDASFDLVWCAGVLMITADEERALDELRRVIRPGGRLYLLVYASGGLRWPLVQLLRPLAFQLGQPSVERAIEAAGLPANKRRTFLDDLFCPSLDFYHWPRLEAMLRKRGFDEIDRWGRAPRLDHEADLESYRLDLEALLELFVAGDAEPFGAERPLFAEGRKMVAATVDTVRWFEERVAAGELEEDTALERVVGQGHHRVMARRGADGTVASAGA
ncbi:MAG: class I SAM-dependent methyltransferase [Holophagales bacterium]|nr:class I SAM-dependent methyltransferase [Holophagales bacterium]